MLNEIYFKDLSKIKTLNQDQTKELAEKIKEGNKQALDELIIANLRLVVFFAKNYKESISNNLIQLDDLVSEGNYGLILAAQRYDAKMDVKFSYYASYWITKYINDFILANACDIRTPQNKIYSDSKIQKVIDEVFNSEKVSPEQLKELDVFSSSEIYHYFNKIHVQNIDENFNPIDSINSMLAKENLDDIKYKLKFAFKYLKPKEIHVIKSYYGIDCEPITDVQLAKEFNVTRQRIGLIRHSALAKMKQHITL